MSRRIVLVVLATVLMIATALSGALVPTGLGRDSSSLATAASTHPSVSSLSVDVYDGWGDITTTFSAGAFRTGSLFFAVEDSDTGDHEVNVTLTDPNATRDGVGSPAFHFVAPLNATTHSYNSYDTGVGYAFPASIPYGGIWSLNLSESSTDYSNISILVEVYGVSLTTSVTGSTLPGSPYAIYWNLTSLSNDASFYTKATNVFITGYYDGNGTDQVLFTHPRNIPLTGASSGYGVFKGTVPANATPNHYLEFLVWAYANISGVTAENASSDVYIAVGELDLYGAGVVVAPPACELYTSSPFGVGSTLAGCVQVYSWFDFSTTPVAGLPVTVGYWNGTTSVSPAGAPTSLVTNAAGQAPFTFVADTPPFTTSTGHSYVYNAVNITVRVPGADAEGYHWTAYANRTWALVPPTAQFAWVNVTLDKTQYFVGQTAQGTWAIHSSDPNLTGPVDPVGWSVSTEKGVVSMTPLNGTAQSGTFSVPVTAAMAGGGDLEVLVVAANATQPFDGAAYATLLPPVLLLTPAETYYDAGSSDSVSVVLEGATGATISYQVVGDWGEDVSNLSAGTVTNGSSIAISVPSSQPPIEIWVDAWGTLNGSAIAYNSADLYLSYGYSIQLGVSTPSSYSDGSYQPGQSVTLTYAVVPIGGAPEPSIVSFELYTADFPAVRNVDNVGPSGSISYTIPSNAPRGTLLVEMDVDTDLGGECLPFGDCEGLVALSINPSPSVLTLELGAGSGVTVGWLIVLVLVLLVGAVGAVLFLRGRARRRQGGGNQGSSSSSAPPEWKPTSGTGSSTSPGGNPPAGPPPGAA